MEAEEVQAGEDGREATGQDTGEEETNVLEETNDTEQPLPGWHTLDFGAGITEITVSKAVEEYLEYWSLKETCKC